MIKYKSTVMDKDAVLRAVKRISHEIIEKNNGTDNLCIIGIKRRGVPLAELIAENIRKIEGVDLETGKLDIKLYRDDLTKISEDATISPVDSSDISFDITGKNIVLVDDVIFTGRTVRAALDAIMQFGRPAKIQLAVLVDRGHRELPIKGDFVGKNIPTSRKEQIAVKLPPFEENISVDIYEDN